MRIDATIESGYPGISLRQLERADVNAWFAYLSNPAVIEHTSWNLRSEDDLLPMFDGFESPDAQSTRRLAIIEGSSNNLVGTIGFHTISDVNRTAEIAYDLASSHWGKGIATSVCASVTDWAFIAYGFVRIQGTVLKSNLPSTRVLQKCGYRHEGLLRSYRMVRGTPSDFNCYARVAND
ncbi:GNAT family N-acetyltransferase [Cupriavidus basilensis]|uniref:GNAT family N-acetyltransferase n=1 Tax=Cupriavidus basilensis TaxID=68895 RepID=UPI0039F6B033